MAADKEHLLHCILFSFQLKKTPAEATQMICGALGKNAVTQKICKEWFQRFEKGNFDLTKRHCQPQEPDDKEFEQALIEYSGQTRQEYYSELLNNGYLIVYIKSRNIRRRVDGLR